MFKIIAFLAKRRELTMAEFIDHYENRHVPLVLSIAPKPLIYKRIYLSRDEPLGRRAEAVDFDAMTELVFADKPAYRAWMAAVAHDAIAADEARFLERARTRAYVIEERGEPD